MRLQKTLFLFLVCSIAAFAQMDKSLLNDINEIESKVIDWRHYFHENPELSNREFNTAKK